MERRTAVRQVGSRPFLVVCGGLVAAVLGVLACYDAPQRITGSGTEASVAGASSRRAQPNPYAFVGRQHNSQVDFILREFLKRRKPKMDQSQVCSLLDGLTREYLKNHGSPAHDFRPHPKHDPCGVPDASGLVTKLRDPATALRIGSVEYDPNFSPAAIDMVNQIENIVLSSGSAAEVASRLVPVNEAAMATLAESDAALVLGVSSVAESSSAYWEASLDYWVGEYAAGGSPLGVLPYMRSGESEIPVGTGDRSRSVDWAAVRGVGWTDVSGGIVGGIRGFIAGPPGVLVGIAQGAAYSSIGAALYHIGKTLGKL